jgi:hypothetical protein
MPEGQIDEPPNGTTDVKQHVSQVGRLSDEFTQLHWFLTRLERCMPLLFWILNEIGFNDLLFQESNVAKLMSYRESNYFSLYLYRSRDSVVGVATSYGLDDRRVGVGVPVGSRIFSSPNRPDRL